MITIGEAHSLLAGSITLVSALILFLFQQLLCTHEVNDMAADALEVHP